MTSKNQRRLSAGDLNSEEHRNIAVVERFFAALNSGDADAAVSFMTDDVLREQFFSSTETYRGTTELRAHISAGRSTWAEGACYPKEISTAGNRVAVHTHVHVRQHGKSDWIDGHVTDTFELRDGKIARFNSYLDRREGFRWAGIEV